MAGTTTRRKPIKHRRELASARKTELPMLRNSERSTLKACEFRWDIIYNRRLKPQTEAPALRFGSLIHGALAAYYPPGIKRGPHPAATFKKLYDKQLAEANSKFGFKDEDGNWNEAGKLGVAMMENYVEEYGKDEMWEVVATEQPFEVLVCRPATNIPWFYYVGILDGIWRKRSNKQLWVPDHKTTAGIGPKTTSHLTLDDQAGGYWSWGVDWLIAEAILKKNQRLAGMLYNFMRKAMPDERPHKLVKGKRHYLNQDGSVSLKQPSPYFLRAPIHRDEYDREQAKVRTLIDYARIEKFRNGSLEMTKSPGAMTCPNCPVLDACELHETGADWEEFLRATTESWDPYAEHEVYEGR